MAETTQFTIGAHLCSSPDQFVEVGAGQSGSETCGESLGEHVVTLGQNRFNHFLDSLM